jgi:hypothetical protein
MAMLRQRGGLVLTAMGAAGATAVLASSARPAPGLVGRGASATTGASRTGRATACCAAASTSSGSGSGSTSPSAEEVVRSIAAVAKTHGLDITVGLTLQDYNSAVESDGLELPTFGRRTTLAVLLGSTKTIWVPFLAALRAADPPGQLEAQAEHDGPLNTFVVRATEALASEVLAPLGLRCELRYAHEMDEGRLVAMQKLAHLSGVAYLHPSCGLNVHPEYGPWHAYRSLLIIDMEGVPTAGPPANPNSAEAVAAAEAALALALESTVDPTATNTKEEMDTQMRQVWRLWQNIRLALETQGCEQWKYSDEHDEYHFTHSPEVLARVVAGEEVATGSEETRTAGKSSSL